MEMNAEKGRERQEPARLEGLRFAAGLILAVAAIFVINAMETGSYRTPWPVALLTLAAGLGLLAAYFVKKRK